MWQNGTYFAKNKCFDSGFFLIKKIIIHLKYKFILNLFKKCHRMEQNALFSV